MFCSKCGKELLDGAQFCSSCGTKVGTVGTAADSGRTMDTVAKKTAEIRDSIAGGAAAINRSKLIAFAGLAAMLLSFIFSLTQIFKISAYGLTQTTTMFEDELFNDATVDFNAFKVLFIIMYLLSIVALACPLLLKNKWEQRITIVPGALTLVSVLVYFAIFASVGAGDLKANKYTAAADFSLTATGWLFILSTICAVALMLKMAYMKQAEKQLLIA